MLAHIGITVTFKRSMVSTMSSMVDRELNIPDCILSYVVYINHNSDVAYVRINVEIEKVDAKSLMTNFIRKWSTTFFANPIIKARMLFVDIMEPS